MPPIETKLVEAYVVQQLRRLGTYFRPFMRLPKVVTLSAVVQSPIIPPSGNVLSSTSNSGLPLKLPMKREPANSTRSVDAVAALFADRVERTPRAVHGLVEHHIVLECVGEHDVVVVGVLGARDDFPAQSSDPEIGLNRTSAKPPRRIVPSMSASG